jgi:hypothetical protein
VSTCLTCRREIERLTTVQRLVATLPSIEPSPSFAVDFWQRLDAESAPAATNVRRLRPLRWAIPALAAAAVLALALRSLTSTPPSPSAPAARVAAAPVAPAAPAAKGANAKLAAQPKPKEEAAQLADVDALRPEDLPPDLLEHPELFLRLPVVRRLEKLEYLGSDQERQGTDDGAG